MEKALMAEQLVVATLHTAKRWQEARYDRNEPLDRDTEIGLTLGAILLAEHTMLTLAKEAPDMIEPMLNAVEEWILATKISNRTAQAMREKSVETVREVLSRLSDAPAPLVRPDELH